MKKVGEIFGCSIYVDSAIPDNQIWVMQNETWQKIQELIDFLRRIGNEKETKE